MKFSRRELESLSLQPLHRARNWSKADVSAGEQGGVAFVLKDFRAAPIWFKPFARAFLRREWKALRALEGTEGVPRALAKPDADSIVLERLPGKPMHGLKYGEVSDETLQKLVALTAKVHACGVTHGDLHQQNVMLGPNGEVGLIDWATAHVWGANPTGARRVVRDEFLALDRRSLAKIKVYHARHLLSAEDIDLIKNGASKAYRAVKSVRRVGERLRGKKQGDVFARKMQNAEKRLAEKQLQEKDAA
ncbi:MAG TPA: phosphotransferase [Abditibacteriaceae bacterium]|jgi:aminoglycoside phosphotransferase